MIHQQLSHAKILVISLVFFGVAGNLFSQGSITVSYALGDIPTSYNVYSASCNGPLATIAITLPPGDNREVTGIDVSYAMTAASSGWMADQRSQIHFQNGNISEPVYSGFGNANGTFFYDRDNVTIANGTYAGGTELIFEMRAWRVFGTTSDCNKAFNKIDAGSWLITVFYGAATENPKVGVSTTNPTQALHVAGKLRIGDDGTAPEAGTIRWNTSTEDFEGFNGTVWLSLTKNDAMGWGGPVSVPENQCTVPAVASSNWEVGISVDMHGEYAVVGAPGANNQGAAYIYHRINGEWVEEFSITPDDPASGDDFGAGVAIHGDRVLVGAPGKTAFYTFTRSGTNWNQEQKVTSSNPSDVSFGSKVDLFDEQAIIYAYFFPNARAYIYSRLNGFWSERLLHTTSVGEFPDNAVTINNQFAAFSYATSNGQIQMFTRNNTVWTVDTLLQGLASEILGKSVALYGNQLVGTNRSGAQVYHFSGTQWQPEQTLVVSGNCGPTGIRKSVGFDGTTIALGTGDGNGTIYVFEQLNSAWTEKARLTGYGVVPEDLFGSACAVSGSHLVAGAPGTNFFSLPDRGKVFFYQK